MTDPLTEMLASLKEKLRAASAMLASHRHDQQIWSEFCIAVNDPETVAALIGCAEALEHAVELGYLGEGSTKGMASDALTQLRKLAEGRRGGVK